MRAASRSSRRTRRPTRATERPPPRCRTWPGSAARRRARVATSESGGAGRLVCADIAALDQTIVYNRFGSFNPFGMMFALRRDLAPLSGSVEGGEIAPLDAEHCSAQLGTESPGGGAALSAGQVRLRDCKRPRPITLRVNVGDTLLVRVSNYLYAPRAVEPSPADASRAPDFSKDFCRGRSTSDEQRRRARAAVSIGDPTRVSHGEAACEQGDAAHDAGTGAELDADVPVGVDPKGGAAPFVEGTGPELHSDWPTTRLVNFVVQGLTPLPDPSTGEIEPACIGSGAVAPDDSFLCRYRVPQEGTYFFASMAAPAGGEGDGGSLVHGLFGAVLAERPGSRWYRSQTSRAAFDAVWPAAEADAPRHARSAMPDYERVDAAGVPILNMARPVDGRTQADFADATAVELVHSDLNAIVFCDETASAEACPGSDNGESETGAPNGDAPAYRAFREFSVFFHDELKTFYTRNFEDIAKLGQMAGVKDGFALNYGASGMGSILMANRKGIGPATDCAECLYEEFFLSSWANGDPALLEWYADDPSNVHHSYLNDPIVFRNFHAGPKETHVFHLHAHQWFAGNDPNRGAYLDSQTVAPQQGFTYDIYHGGRRGIDGEGQGWWDTQGSGNRNRTVGDSIFHCHLYPHFAQGMWALWRVHDVLEDGTRLLPDGQPHAGLSIDFPEPGADGHKRLGSVDRTDGQWREEQRGTPVPALIPLPGQALPLLPTYAQGDTTATPMPGYPFYIAGEAGHRAPQAPLDIARELPTASADNISVFGPDGSFNQISQGAGAAHVDEREPVIDPATGRPRWQDGGLGRHLVLDGSEREFGFALPDIDPATLGPERRATLASQIVAKAFALGDLSAHLHSANLELLDNDGTRLERAAMGFHFDGRLHDPEQRTDDDTLLLRQADGSPSSFADGLYASPVAPAPTGAVPGQSGWAVNASPPKPGAPFADPCGAAPQAQGSLALSGDPLATDGLPAAPYAVDPLLTGFRRYEVSAVQLDMVVNRAGWHDPQARINVLSADADRYKDTPKTLERISPLISDREEPFFFRALSGECIEFRHTNEVPKELELDDFQVRTPTDTIGQHIHLVKFDVTASDGSGNGWNYEDGTFAADEIATRRCASVLGSPTIGEGVLQRPIAADECVDGRPRDDAIWRTKRSERPELFQTTVQRWFADPILSRDEDDERRDRTLRTVFTHDHFAPSSIQQHGFYSALVIEPGVTFDAEGNAQAELKDLCESSGNTGEARCASPINDAERHERVAFSDDLWTGSRKTLYMRGADSDRFHPDHREFALSIADFALLYDPRDRDSAAEFAAGIEPLAGASVAASGGKGMQRLYCEARWRLSPWQLEHVCGNPASRDAGQGSWFFEGDVPPAWIAGGVNRDDVHKGDYHGDTIVSAQAPSEVDALRDHAIDYRRRAAGRGGESDPDARSLASPVAPPLRPEAISVDHHDPYLVNYRGAPIPLRIGDRRVASYDDAPDRQSPDCVPKAIARAGVDTASDDADASEVVAALAAGSFDAGSFDECSIQRQVEGQRGDMAGALMSALHGDPETPVLEAYQNERFVLRMIQGAQEVQHTFGIVGLPFKRNLDQAFSRGMRPLAVSDEHALETAARSACLERVAEGRPGEYRAWLDGGSDAPLIAAPGFWREYEAALAECDNLEGFTFAQEIGISEHFELQGSLRSDVSPSLERALLDGDDEAAEAATDDDPSLDAALEAAGADGELDLEPPEDLADYLYSFGTVDALWNGAWGLFRIYEDGEAIDPATRNLPEPRAIGDRLGAGAQARTESATGEEAEVPEIAGLACPLEPLPGEDTTRHTEAVVVAVETHRLASGPGAADHPVYGAADYRGTDYGGPLHDPDGLMLALLEPEALLPDGLRASDEAWATLEEVDVLRAIRARYPSGPRPFTLRVNAGDCVRLRVVNLLRADADGGLLDGLGDAEFPPIVPLGVDPPFGGVEFRDAEAARADGRPRRVGRLAPVERGLPPGGLRPSARLALGIGLPGMDLIRDLPLAYGHNRSALEPSDDDAVTVSDELRFYAGRFRLDADVADVAGELSDALAGWFDARVGGWLRGGGEALPRSATETGGDPADASFGLERSERGMPGFVTLLGRRYTLVLRTDEGAFELAGIDGGRLVLDGTPEATTRLVDAYCAESLDGATCLSETMGAVAELRGFAARRTLELLDERTHWIPYAFGTVPIVSTSDVVSHTQHGLFGAIDVLPVDWALGPEHGVTRDAVDGSVRSRSMGHVDAGDGQPAAFTDGSGERVREFVLYFQDGLNLHDRRSRIDWRWDDDGAAVLDADGEPLDSVPDCPVCDDSYDRGEKAVSYRSVPFSLLLREQLPEDQQIDGSVEISDDLNVHRFPPDHLVRAENALRLEACEGEQVLVRVMHPGGRARQRAFVMNGYTYDDLYPGFGFPRSALLAPGKSISAWLAPRARPGLAVWHDGPTPLRAGGTWGLLDVGDHPFCDDGATRAAVRRGAHEG